MRRRAPSCKRHHREVLLPLRIRTIKPEACTSESMGRIAREARLFFHYLTMYADDAGRFRYLPKAIAGALYPHDVDVTPSVIEDWTTTLEREGMVERYSVDGSAFAWIPNLLKHQVINRPTPSKLPAPPVRDGEASSVTIRGGLSECSVTAHGGLSETYMTPPCPEIGSRKKEEGDGERETASAVTPESRSGVNKESEADQLWSRLPQSHQTAGVRSAIDAYFQLKTEKRWGRWAPSTLDTRAQDAAKFTPEIVEQAFAESARQQWKGVFFEKYSPKEPNGAAVSSKESVSDATKRIQGRMREHRKGETVGA